VKTTEKELKWRWKWRGLKEEDANLSSIVVLDEFRVLATEGGWFEDTFGPYAVHVYGPF